jgi:protein translocase SecG subunit
MIGFYGYLIGIFEKINYNTIMLLTIFQKIFLWGFIVFQTLLCILLIFLILLQKNDDGGVGPVFMRTSILYNRSENLFTRKIIMFLSTLVFFGCLGLSVYFYKVNKNQYQIVQLINNYGQ